MPGSGYFVVFFAVSALAQSSGGAEKNFCRLNPHPSVEYRCRTPNTYNGLQTCAHAVASGTEVFPKCKTQNYYLNKNLASMICKDGNWSYIATCLPDCGKLTPSDTMFEAEEGYFQRVKIPWHASFYEKYGLEYLNKCMGTIITTSHVLSAANCFWDDGLRKLNPASKYAVVGGALVDAWDRLDGAVHKSKIKDIKIPVDYTGHKTNYQKDIALVFLSTPFVYDLRIRPVCLDFDMEFDKKQLIPGNLGIFTGHLNFDEPPFLLVASYIDSGTCAGMASSWHRKYITSDKICGKISFDDMNNRLPAGQGLAFPATEGGQRRYYLRGVLSVGLYPPHNSVRDLYVTSKNLLAFTHLLAHKTFIKDSITVEKYRTSM